ncbi:MAG TPA: BON domain-containing protein [Terriglobales bacterium]|nr:BON domain-containing protein [Terriglobales bacterium]
MKYWIRRMIGSAAAVTLLSSLLLAQAASVNRYDNTIQQQVTRKLDSKKEFKNVHAAVEDGIVSLTGTVDVYQQKLDAARQARKVEHAAGVRNLITVAGPAVPDAELQAKLNEKLWYDRIGYDNLYNYFTLAVNDGVVTIGGQTYNDVGKESALATVQRMPGVTDVIDNITTAPVSIFDDDVRIRATRAIYRDPVLSRYAIDPALPIRIIVDNGHIGLYGTVATPMDKQIAGIRAGQVFGAFRVENHLVVSKSEKMS